MMRNMNTVSTRRKVLEEIEQERQRQVVDEGYDYDHDDAHSTGELALAAASYAVRDLLPGSSISLWPWHPAAFKPKDHRSNLVRAAALIVAEIERIDRERTSS